MLNILLYEHAHVYFTSVLYMYIPGWTLCLRNHDHGGLLDDGSDAHGRHWATSGRPHALDGGHRVKTDLYELSQGQCISGHSCYQGYNLKVIPDCKYFSWRFCLFVVSIT